MTGSMCSSERSLLTCTGFYGTEIIILLILLLLLLLLLLLIIIIIIIIPRMWNVKTRVIPVITGATGTISKSFRKYVSTIPGNHDVRELQKTAILGTVHMLRKVLM
jgi:ABC-type multidrug transport system permease subunit